MGLLSASTDNVLILPANIAESMLRSDRSRQQQDLRAFGLVLRELMELGSVWTDAIRGFCDKLNDSKVSSLLGHEFLQKSSGPASLVPHARVAMRTKLVSLRVLM